MSFLSELIIFILFSLLSAGYTYLLFGILKESKAEGSAFMFNIAGPLAGFIIVLTFLVKAYERIRRRHYLRDFKLFNDFIKSTIPQSVHRQVAIDWSERLIRDVKNQIETKKLKLHKTKLADPLVQEIILSMASEGNQVLATCFSEMDDFYFKPGIGSEFFDLNIRMIEDKKATIERVFAIDTSFENVAIRYGQLIRLYVLCNVNVFVAEPDFVAKLKKKLDFFLILDENKERKCALEFEFNSFDGEIEDIHIILDPARLEELHQYYIELKKVPGLRNPKAKEFDLLPKISKDIQRREFCKNFVKNLSGNNENTNLIRYFAPESSDSQAIADYWNQLKGSLIRMDSAQGQQFQQMIIKAKSVQPQSFFQKTLVLGCTPEARSLAGKFSKEVDVADISRQTYEAMTLCLKMEESIIGNSSDQWWKREQFLPIEWCSLYKSDLAYDLILGVDVLNMIPRNQLRDFLESLNSILGYNGQIVFQYVRKDIDFIKRSGGLVTSERPHLKNVFKENIQKVKKLADPASELFARLAMSQFESSRHLIETRRIVRFLEHHEEFDEVARIAAEKHRLCNTTLYLHEESFLNSELTTQFQAYDYLSPASSSRDSFQSLFSLIRLAKKSKPR